METISAVTRQERGGNLSPPDAIIALAEFQQDFGQQYMPVEISAALIAHAGSLARRHTLRGYDAVQLAAALEVVAMILSLIFVSADGALNAAATADGALNAAATVEGLLVEDPNAHP